MGRYGECDNEGSIKADGFCAEKTSEDGGRRPF